jgi:hypothetical protein
MMRMAPFIGCSCADVAAGAGHRGPTKLLIGLIEHLVVDWRCEREDVDVFWSLFIDSGTRTLTV